MKPLQIKTIKGVLFLTTLLTNVTSFANQNSRSESISSAQYTSWYLQPWLWMAAAGFLSLLIVSALRGRIKG